MNMILGITSLGEGRMQMRKRFELWLAHTLGGALGGLCTAATLVIAATPFRTMLPAQGAVGVALLLVGIALLADLTRLPLHGRRRQLPATWTSRIGERRAFGLYGFMLGSGLMTYVPFAITIAIYATAALLAPVPLALVAGALFGIGRTGATALGAVSPIRASTLLYRSPTSRTTGRALSLALLVVLALVISIMAVQDDALSLAWPNE